MTSAIDAASGLPELAFEVTRTSVDHFMTGLRHVAIALAPGWSGLDPAAEADFKVEQISGGITNALFKVTRVHDATSALVRIFGDKTELVIDRERERSVVAQLAPFGLGTPLFGYFANGRVEQFLPGRALTPPDLVDPLIAPLIATALAELHTVPLPTQPPTLFDTLEKWLEAVQLIRFDEDPAKAALLASIDVRDRATDGVDMSGRCVVC